MTGQALDDPMVPTANNRPEGERTYHTTRCQAIRRANATRKATERELRDYRECTYCVGQEPNRTPDFSYQRTLREASSDD